MPRPAASPVRRSDRTRAAILAAARERFARHGYEGTTIRAIAAEAEIDPAMVMRYFGSKEKLFAEAAEFDLRLPDLAAMPRDRIGHALAEHLLDVWESDDRLLALLRAAGTNDVAAKRMRGIFAAQLIPTIVALGLDSATAGTRASLIASQALGLTLTRYILRLPPMVAMPRAEIIGWLGPVFQRYIVASSAST